MNNPTAANSHGFVPELEGLRGVAILLVLVSHFGLGPASLDFVSHLGLGHIGVRLFFVLSGFLITSVLLLDLDKASTGGISPSKVFYKFYASRTLRIFPIYYLTIILLYLIDFQGFRDVSGWHFAYLSNLDGVRYITTDAGTILRHPSTAHFWSLAIEEQFYLLYPLLAVLLTRHTLFWVLCAAVAAAPAWRIFCIFILDPSYPHTGLMLLPGVMDSLCLGALAALYQRGSLPVRQPMKKYIRTACTCCAIVASGLLVLYWQDTAVRLYLALFDSVLALICATVVILLVNLPGASRGSHFLRARNLRLIGRISYGLYIYHAFATHILSWLLLQVNMELQRETMLYTGLLYLMAFSLAYVSWHLIERPLLAFKPYVVSRLMTSKSVPPGKGTTQATGPQ